MISYFKHPSTDVMYVAFSDSSFVSNLATEITATQYVHCLKLFLFA